MKRAFAGLALGISTLAWGVPVPVTEPAADPDPDILEVPAPQAPLVDTGDLDAIRRRGALRILTWRGDQSLLPRAGAAPTDPELAKAFAEQLGVGFQEVPVSSYQELIPMLLAGHGDLIAARMTETTERATQVAFSRPLRTVDEVVIGGPGVTAPRAGSTWRGTRVKVRRSSSYAQTLATLGATLVWAPEDDSDFALARAAVAERALTVVDSDGVAELQALLPEITAHDAIARGRQLAFALRPTNPGLKVAVDAFVIEQALTAHKTERGTGDLDAIKARGSLRVAMKNDATSYFLYKGIQQGFDLELAKAFAQLHRLRVDVVVPAEGQDHAALLEEGQVDLVAPSLWAEPLHGVPVTAENFGVRAANPHLKAALTSFVTQRGGVIRRLQKKYLSARAAAQHRAVQAGKERISTFDPLIQRYSRQYGIDWRLMAAQAYQESFFDPKAESWCGAQGLFQVMPKTGRALGFKDVRAPEQNVHAGIKYMAQLIGELDPAIPFKHRVRFALASYNAGPHHVSDARLLAKEMGLDPDKWFNHVEKAMLRLEDPKVYRRMPHGFCRGSEPVKYVSDIQSRYDNWVVVLPATDLTRSKAP